MRALQLGVSSEELFRYPCFIYLILIDSTICQRIRGAAASAGTQTISHFSFRTPAFSRRSGIIRSALRFP
jgi:hypothetical protein